MTTYNAREAAAQAGVSFNTIRTAISVGKLKARKGKGVGGPAEWIIEAADLEAYMTLRGHVRPAVESSGVVRELAAGLQTRVAVLEATIAALRSRAPWLFAEGVPPPAGDGQQAGVPVADGPIPAGRHTSL